MPCTCCPVTPKARTRLETRFCHLLSNKLQQIQVSLVAQLVKNPPAMWETWVQSLRWEDPLEKGMATHSSIVAWRIPWTCIVHGVAKSRTRLRDFHFQTPKSDTGAKFQGVAQKVGMKRDFMIIK